MKSIIIKNEKTKFIPFPKLMISDDDMVVLFSDNCRGMVVYPGNGATMEFTYYNSFNMDKFVDFDGKVILTNQSS